MQKQLAISNKQEAKPAAEANGTRTTPKFKPTGGAAKTPHAKSAKGNSSK